MSDRPQQPSPADAAHPAGAAAPYEWRMAFSTELFSAPELGSAVVARLPAGAEVMVLDERGAFRRVQTTDGRVGYVGKLALVRSRPRAAQAARPSDVVEEPPPLPWELERLGAQPEAAAPGAGLDDRGSTAAAQPSAGPTPLVEVDRDEPPPLPWERERLGAPSEDVGDVPSAAVHRPAPPTPRADSESRATDAAGELTHPPVGAYSAAPAAAGTRAPPAGATTPPDRSSRRRWRRRGPLWLAMLPGVRRLVAWLRARRIRHRAPAALAVAAPPAAVASSRRLRRRALALLAALLLLVALFEALAWGLGLLGQPRRSTAEPPGSPVVAAVRGADGRIEVSVDTRALAGAAGVGVVWIVLVVLAAGAGAALPAAAMLVPAMGLAAALNAASGLMPPEKVLLLDVGGLEAAATGGPPLALRQATRERVTLTVRGELVDTLVNRLPGGAPPARPRIVDLAPSAAGASTQATIVLSETVVAAGQPRPPGSLDVGFILDASGSMLERLGSRQKIEIAKEVLDDFVGHLQPTVHVGLWAYGHRRGDRAFQCQQVELLYPIGPVQPQTLRERIREITPFGWTPIARAIELAARDFRRLAGISEVMVLISDGEETCGGDPVKAVSEARRANPDLTIHTVGLAVTLETRQQLERIAAVGGGRYYDASDAASLAAALATITRPAPARPGG